MPQTCDLPNPITLILIQVKSQASHGCFDRIVVLSSLSLLRCPQIMIDILVHHNQYFPKYPISSKLSVGQDNDLNKRTSISITVFYTYTSYIVNFFLFPTLIVMCSMPEGSKKETLSRQYVWQQFPCLF